MAECISDAQIAQWRASKRRDHQIAAAIAVWARGKDPWTPLPPIGELAADLGFVSSRSTWSRALDTLARLEVISWREHEGYYVADQADGGSDSAAGQTGVRGTSCQ